MASAYPGPVSAVQVGSYFVGQYYQVLQQQPNLVHQFYSEASSMIRVDGDSIDSASAMLHIHTLILSLNFTAIEIKTINSLDSWNGGILVMVSGSVKTKEFSGRRKFVQTFLLAPQEKGYFVLNDIFQFIDDGMIYQNPTSILPESKFDSQLNASSPLPEPPVSDYGLEEEAREYVSSVHIEDDPVDKYSLPEQQQQYGLPEQQQQYGLPEQQQQYGLPEQQQQYGLPEQHQQYGLPEQQLQQDLETEIEVEETPIEETSSSLQTAVDVVQENPSVAQEELVGETQKKTYASILRVAKGQSAPSVVTQPSFMGSQTASDWNHSPQPLEQQSNSALSFGPETGVEPAEESYALEEEGEPKSVYVRNLPPDVTEVEIEQEFKNFGRIKPDGVFIRLRKEFGVCYAFVEFEDIIGVHNALKASPIQLAGRQIYVEERRPNSSGVSRGGRGRGRGRGIYQAESTRGRFGGRSFGRGNQDVGDYNRLRGNGFHQRGSR